MNIASRLLGRTKYYGIRVKVREGAISVYEPLGRQAKLWSDTLGAYRSDEK